MSFLQPAYLWGLLALAIPIIIHLFYFRRVKKVYFSNTRFLQAVKQSTRQRLRLKHYLILASRLLFVAFLVLAFAQPFIPAAQKELPGSGVAIYLDNSLSMSNEVAPGLSALDEGIDRITQIVSLFPEGTRYRLLTNSFKAGAANWLDGQALLDQLTEVKTVGIGRSFNEVVKRLRSYDNAALGGQTQSSTQFFISDFQRNNYTEGTTKADTASRMLLVPLAFENTANVMVDSLYLEDPFLINGIANTLNLRLRNTGAEDVQDLIVRFFVNDVQVSSTSLSLNAESTAQAQFPLNMALQNINQCRISFEEFPVAFDNDFYFTLALAGRINILEIAPEQGAYISGVYGNTNLFNYRFASPDNLDYSLLAQADFVVLNGLSAPDQALRAALLNYVQTQQRPLLVVPGPESEAPAFQSLVSGSLQNLDTLGAQPLEAPDLNNPFFANMFARQDAAVSMPAVNRLWQWRNAATTYLRQRSGAPFLSAFNNGGQVYVLAAPLQDAYGAFHQNALFVPIMYKLASQAARQQQALYYTTDQTVLSTKLDSLSGKEVFSLRRQDQELTPAQRINGSNVLMEVPRFLLSAGFYTLATDAQDWGTLAFNYAAPESILAQYSPEELEALWQQYGKVTVFKAANAQDFAAGLGQDYFGTMLWRWALMLALLFLLAEVLLIRFA